MSLMWLRAAVIAALSVWGCTVPGDGAGLGSFVDLEVFSVDPSEGSVAGGSRLFVRGKGFDTDFFDGGQNIVQVGRAGIGWAACDVIEGACSVDCGSGGRVVCDLGAFVWAPNTTNTIEREITRQGGRVPAGLLDVRVETGMSQQVQTLTAAFRFLPTLGHTPVPKLHAISPQYFTTEQVINVTGTGLPSNITDYRVAYIGAGTPIIGGNIGLGKVVTKAQCRPQSHNRAVPEGFEDEEHTTPVNQEDTNTLPISPLMFRCQVCDRRVGGCGRVICLCD